LHSQLSAGSARRTDFGHFVKQSEAKRRAIAFDL
jgi:hypothetical protein